MKLREAHRRTCHRHKRFQKEGQAFAHLIERIRANEVDPGCTTYRCLQCRGWHVGSPKGGPSLGRVMQESA